MAVSLPNGVTLSIATSYAAAKNITAVSNANPAQATATAHGFLAGDFLEVKSGWQRINDRIVRVGTTPATDNFKLDGIDTTDTTVYPAGTGTGSVRKISAFTQITQITDLSTSGGDMQFAQYSFLETDFEAQIPTQASAMSLTLTIADDPTLAGYQALKVASDARNPVALMMAFPNGSKILYNGYVSFNETPQMQKGNVMTCQATFSLLSKPMRYAA